MKTLFTFVFSLLFAVASFAQITLTNDSLLAYYSFDNNSNNQHADRFHLSPVFNTGFVGPIYDTGKKGTGVRFNKNNALVNTAELANHLAASQNKSLSLSFWINYSSSNTALSTFIEFYESLFMRNSTSSFGMFSNNQWFTVNHINSASLANSGWRHITIVYNATDRTLVVYIDGENKSIISMVGTAVQQITNRIVIGAGTTTTNFITNYNWANKGFEGVIDEMYLYNRVLSSAEVTDLFFMRVIPPSEVSNEKLIAYYDFEDGQNKAGNNYHLTATMLNSNIAAPAFVTGGKVGNAVSFNGNNALWNTTEFGPTWDNADKNLTISAWVKRNNAQTAQYYTMFEMFESFFLRANINLGISRANLVFNNTNSGNITANQWVHVVGVYDQQAQQIRLYINGDLVGSINGISGFHAYNPTFIVGAGINSGLPNFAGKAFIGDIDEMYIFNRVLTAAEIYGMTNLVPVVSVVPKFPVTFSASAGGTLTATVDGVAISSGDMVEEGKTITFTATPDAGMQIANWFNHDAMLVFRGVVPTVHGVLHLEPGTNRTVTFGTAAYTVNFDTQNPAGTISATVNGDAISSGSTVGHLTRVIVTAAPATGYFLSHWIINGVTHVSEGLVPLTQNIQITQNTTFVAVFARDPAYAQVNFSVVGGNGTLTAKYQIQSSGAAAPAMKAKAVNPFVTIQNGDMVPKTSMNQVYVTFEATPNQGYAVGTWTENGTAYTSESPVSNTYGMNVYNDINVTVSFVVAETSVRNASYQALSLYPNPARDMVRIVADSNIDRVEIYSLSGALQQSETGFGARNMNIQLANLNEGLYLVKTYTDEGLQTAKLQVKR